MMRIESMDASGVMPVRNTEPVAAEKKAQTDTKDNINNIAPSAQMEKKEVPVSEKFMTDAIEKANKALLGSNRHLKYSVHEKTKEIMVKVIDSETNEVIKEFPPEKILDMIAKMWEMAGIVVDERR